MSDSAPGPETTPDVDLPELYSESGSHAGHGMHNYNYAHQWQRELSPSGPTSPASPSLSLPSLLMSPFSPGRQQGVSPLMSRPSTSGPANYQVDKDYFDEQGQDPRELLVRRLGKLAVQVTEQPFMEEDVLELHARIDEMETAMGTPPRPIGTPSRFSFARSMSRSYDDGRIDHRPNPAPARSVGVQTTDSASSLLDNGPLRPYQESKPQMEAPQAHLSAGVGMSLDKAQRVAEEAQALNRGLEATITNLRARQEESDHIHGLLVTRAERAAQHIIYLEGRVKELERERNEGELEILDLQIQLKAFEVQYMNSESGEVDPDLRRSISSWKSEWSALKRKRTRKKDEVIEAAQTPETPIRRIQRIQKREDQESIFSQTPDTPLRGMRGPG